MSFEQHYELQKRVVAKSTLLYCVFLIRIRATTCTYMYAGLCTEFLFVLIYHQFVYDTTTIELYNTSVTTHWRYM